MKYLIVFASLLTAAHAGLAQTADPCEKWIVQLRSKQADQRIEALVALAELGPPAKAAIPALAKLLPGIDDEERILATMALAQIGKASLADVEKLLTHEDETTRFYAVWTIGLIGKDANALVPRLLTLLEKDEDEEVRVKAVSALAWIAPDSNDVLSAFAKRSAERNVARPQRLAIIDALRHCGPGALEPLVAVLDDPVGFWKARQSLADLLTRNQTEAFARRVVPHLPVMLAKSDPELDGLADDGLSFVLAKHGDQVVSLLADRLRDKKSATQLDAVAALGHLGSGLAARSEHPELVDKINAVLLPVFRSTDPRLRAAVANTAPYVAKTFAAFDELLIDDELHVRSSAYNRVQRARTDPAPRIRTRLGTATAADKVRCASALYYATRDPGMGDILWAALSDKDPAQQHRAACALAANLFGTQEADKIKKQILPILLASLQSDSPERRRQAALMLAHSLAPLRDHVPTLLGRLDDPDQEVRLHLLNALRRHADADAQGSLARLVPLLKHENEHVRLAAAAALSSLGKGGVPSIMPLAQSDRSPLVWQGVCALLKSMKSEAKSAVPVLLRTAQNPERRRHALAAIVAIAPDENFSAIWEIVSKDSELGKLTYPKRIYASSGVFRDALLRDWRTADTGRRRDIAVALKALIPLLPDKKQMETIKRIGPLLDQQWTTTAKDLQAADAKVRRDAIALLGQVRLLYALPLRAPYDPNAEKMTPQDMQKAFAVYAARNQKFDKLIRRARADADLQVRRAARQADGINDGMGYPFLWGSPMFGPGLGAGPFPSFP